MPAPGPDNDLLPRCRGRGVLRIDPWVYHVFLSFSSERGTLQCISLGVAVVYVKQPAFSARSLAERASEPRLF